MKTIEHAKNKRWKKRLMVSTPTLGLIRYEWAVARYSQIIPVNWESSGFDCRYQKGLDYSPVGFGIDDAYNLITQKALETKVEWLLVIEDDVVIPSDCFVRMDRYVNKGDVPIVSGLYYLKGTPTQPLVFRGRGNGSFNDFKIGAKVWADGIPMGCLLVHMSVLKALYDESEPYKTIDGHPVRRVFETPRRQFLDPQTFSIFNLMGTQDLEFCDRVLNNGIFKKAGWPKYQRKKYPFLVDTGIFCKHIDINTGIAYP